MAATAPQLPVAADNCGSELCGKQPCSRFNGKFSLYPLEFGVDVGLAHRDIRLGRSASCQLSYRCCEISLHLSFRFGYYLLKGRGT